MADQRPSILRAYNLETLPRDDSLVEGSDSLMAHPFWAERGFFGDACYRFVSRHILGPRRVRALRLTDASILDRFLREAAVHNLGEFTARFAADLEIEAVAGHACNPSNGTAARVWLALTESKLPFYEIPYVQALGQRSIGVIEKNLALGYGSQDEVDNGRPSGVGR